MQNSWDQIWQACLRRKKSPIKPVDLWRTCCLEEIQVHWEVPSVVLACTGGSRPLVPSLVLPLLSGGSNTAKKPGALKGALWSSNPANQGAQRWAVSNLSASLTNLYGKHDLTAIFILEVSCARLPCNESWLNWVRNSRLITLLAPGPQHRGFCSAEGEEAAWSSPNSPFPLPGWFPRHLLWRALVPCSTALPACSCGAVWLGQGLAVHV